ncbi:hypothetical protein MPSEU_000119200 [Mayamaea pseudoterrestris]|nr:hypothetical protein MPSEU_000119200 [Mayamaea pseudoterrestris]
MVFSSRISASLLFFGWLVRAHDSLTTSNSHWHHDHEDPILHHRNLQNDPCTASKADATVFDYPGSSDLFYLKPSYFEGCVESIEMFDNGTRMLDHLDGLFSVFSEYHSFFDISKDPAASDPLVYGAEHGYQVYGENSGKVDLLQGFLDIYNDIVDTGVAGQATFWNISSLVNQLRDAHIQLQLASLFPYAPMYLVANRIVEYNGISIMVPTFSIDKNSNLQLKLQFRYDDNNVEEAAVSTINGKSVHDFMVDLANEPALPLGYQSLGARINDLMTTFKLFNFPFGTLPVSGRPSDVLPDSFKVVYQDGTSENFYSTIAIADSGFGDFFSLDASSGNTFSVNRTYWEIYAILPGNLRYNYDVAFNQITSAPPLLSPDDGGRRMTVKDSTIHYKHFNSKTRKMQEKDNFVFDEVVSVPPLSGLNGTNVAAFKIENDYAILKLPSFAMLPNQTANIYYQVAQAAKAAGVKKLMIDVSDNGGGVAMSGLTLAHLMYPSLDFLTWFRGRWSARYNSQMMAFKDNVFPIVVELLALLENSKNTSDLSEFQLSLGNITADAIDTATVTVNNMQGLCPSEGLACVQLLPNLTLAMSNFGTLQSPENLFDLVLQFYFVLAYINPWTVGISSADPNELAVFVSDTTLEQINYGGSIVNMTDRFDLSLGGDFLNPTLEEIADIVAKTTIRLGDFTFDKFVIVSNGLAGSTTALFTTSVQQIWNNRDQSGVTQPLTTIAYGGSGKVDDIAMTGFPAAIENVNLDYPLVTNAALYALEAIFSGNADYYAFINSARTTYDNVLGAPPYYSRTVPTLPVVTYYDTFMGPNALPMQYIYIPPNIYIAKIYTSVSIEDGSDLEALYLTASKYFSSNSSGSGGSSSNGGGSVIVGGGSGSSSGASSMITLAKTTFVSATAGLLCLFLMF